MRFRDIFSYISLWTSVTLVSYSCRICPTLWMLLKSQTSWVFIHYVTATGTFKLLVQQAEMACMRAWTGCPISSRVQTVKFSQFIILTISGCLPGSFCKRDWDCGRKIHCYLSFTAGLSVSKNSLDVLLRIVKWLWKELSIWLSV